MGVFADMRAALTADLGAVGVPVHPAWPDVVDALPCLFVIPPVAASLVEGGQTYGEVVLSLDVVVLVEPGEAQAAFTACEGLVEDVLRNSLGDWSLTGVDAPAPIAVVEGGAEYFGAVVHLSKPTHLN